MVFGEEIIRIGLDKPYEHGVLMLTTKHWREFGPNWQVTWLTRSLQSGGTAIPQVSPVNWLKNARHFYFRRPPRLRRWNG
ncbi:MAG: hypothetical protein BroJett011_59430 [Chloroflexota bacterium]|nr:MAG: hypothetical protein BroJett011_59430 [Chloroflexota bacterium]